MKKKRRAKTVGVGSFQRLRCRSSSSSSDESCHCQTSSHSWGPQSSSFLYLQGGRGGGRSGQVRPAFNRTDPS